MKETSAGAYVCHQTCANDGRKPGTRTFATKPSKTTAEGPGTHTFATKPSKTTVDRSV